MSNIKAIRLALGLTQQKFAEGVGCTQSAVGQFERGETTPSVEIGKRVVGLAADAGREVSLDHVYGMKPWGDVAVHG
ncbi:helix-turn-helix transcriptional regulator [Comamonas sp. wu1-DMT]|uniref:helix-turn-helix transcriptional regulator n=1 Tax=Comamonas sp. wu1-DMT TaxID=3126390 RepID=UPI0032E51EFB